jgi:hypothetical protein
MTPNLPKGLGQRLEQGMEAAFAADSLTQLGDAIDLEALERGDPEAMDFEQMGELVGQMTGRLVIKQTVGRYTPGQFAEQTVGYAIGGAIGREGGKLLVQVVENQRGEPVEVEIEVIDEKEIEDSEDIYELGEDDIEGLDDGDGLDEFGDSDSDESGESDENE